jgi:hypothetical protein
MANQNPEAQDKIKNTAITETENQSKNIEYARVLTMLLNNPTNPEIQIQQLVEALGSLLTALQKCTQNNTQGDQLLGVETANIVSFMEILHSLESVFYFLDNGHLEIVIYKQGKRLAPIKVIPGQTLRNLLIQKHGIDPEQYIISHITRSGPANVQISLQEKPTDSKTDY